MAQDHFCTDHRLDDLIEGLWRVLGDRGLSRETKIEETIRVGERMGVLEDQRPLAESLSVLADLAGEQSCPGCGAPHGYPPAGPCIDHGTAKAFTR